MKKSFQSFLPVIVIVAMILSFIPAQPAHAVSASVVISQVYGGGGNSGAIYTYDFVELFNKGTETVSLEGWSIQYASASGTGAFGASATQITPLSGSIAPGQYLLIQEAAGSNVIADLPTPDITDATPIAMSGTGAKVALVNIATGLGCNGGSIVCDTTQLASIVDLVGWGTSTNFYEGAAAPATSNSTAVIRNESGCMETDNNAADFIVVTPSPRNSASPYNVCSIPTEPTNPTGTGAFSPATIYAGDPVLLTLAVTPGTNPTSTGLAATCDLSGIGGVTGQSFFDDGTNGDATAGDNTFSLSTIIPSITAVGTYTLGCAVTDAELRSGAGSIDVTVSELLPTNPTLVGTVSPTTLFSGDPILLTLTVTPGANPASTGLATNCDLTGIGGSAVQGFYDDGTNGDLAAGDNVFTFATTIAPGTAGGTQSLPCSATDAQARTGSGTIGLTITQILPIGAVNGAVSDSEDATLHRSPFAPASGNGAGSTYVTIKGVVYEKTLQATTSSTTYKGFFIQNTAANADADPTTSDGIFVYMGKYDNIANYTGSGYYVPNVGDELVISGKITEYYNMTELTSAKLVVAPIRTGVDIEAEVPPASVNPPDELNEANRYWERLQGMRVQVPAGSIVLGGRNVFSPADAEVWVASPDSDIALRTGLYTNRAFRDAHPLDNNYDPINWDGNGYRILMGSWGIKAATGDAQTLIDAASTFDTVTNAPAGGLNYTYSKYRIEIASQPTYADGVDPAANNPPSTIVDRSVSYSIADYNLENVYDFRDNPFSGCDFTSDSGCPAVSPFLSKVTSPFNYVPLSEADYQARISDIATQIINDLHSPDILMVQEVENQDFCTISEGAVNCGTTDNADGKPDVLQDLAVAIASQGGPIYESAYDRDSSDLRGIAPAFMYRTDRVELLPAAGDPVLGADPAVVYAGASVPANSDVSNPKTLNAVLPSGVEACETSWVFPRAPGIALFRIFSNVVGDGNYGDVYVINNHFKSTPTSCIPHRTEQAKYNAALVSYIQSVKPGARIVVGGDLNVYPRPDDIAYNASDQLGSLYDPAIGLQNLWEVLLGQAPEAAYSYVYMGMAQTLDQMFVNQPLLADLQEFRIAHINSDFPADYSSDVARGTSDHDPNVATFLINAAPTADAGGPYIVDEGSMITLTANGTDLESGLLTYAWDLNNDGVFETEGQSVPFTGINGPATVTVNVQVTDNGGAKAVASTTITVNNLAPVVNAGGPYVVDEGSSITLSATAVDPGGDPLTYVWDLNNDGTFETPGQSVTYFAINGPATPVVNVQVKDDAGSISTASATITVNNVAPTLAAISIKPGPIPIHRLVIVTAMFTDPGKLDRHTVSIDWGDGVVTSGIIRERRGSGSVQGYHAYTKQGIYTITMTVTDKDGGTSNTVVYENLVVYNPRAQVSGNGWFLSPVDQFKTKFDFDLRYTFANFPKGNIKVNLSNNSVFRASRFDWLLIDGKSAKVQGVGTINGQGQYYFELTAVDAQTDTVQLKIWNADGIVFDTSTAVPLGWGKIKVKQ